MQVVFEPAICKKKQTKKKHTKQPKQSNKIKTKKQRKHIQTFYIQQEWNKNALQK